LPGVGCTVSGSSTVTGSTTPLTTTLSYPAPSAGSYATTNNNSQIAAYMTGSDFEIAGGTVHLAGGTYYVHNMMLRQAAKLYLDGPVTFYVTGTFTIQDSVETEGNRPKDFKIYMTTSAVCTIAGSNTFEAEVYAPLSDVTISQSRWMNGSVIGKTLTVTNSAQCHFDTTLSTATTSGSDTYMVR
jgi:hypothetical protein